MLAVGWWGLVFAIEPAIGSAHNLENILASALPLLIVALGETIVLLTGGIDLSVISTVCITSVLGGAIMTGDGGLLSGSAAAAPVAIALMVSCGALIGSANGFAIAFLGMPPFMVTLTAMILLDGVAVWSTRSETISNIPDSFDEAIAYGSIAGIPYTVLIAGGAALALFVFLSRTATGRWARAIGHNRRAARAAGVPVARVLVVAYALSGALAAVASILYMARFETGAPRLLDRDRLLDVIAAVVIGGTSLFGGRGGVLSTVVGVFFVTIVRISLTTLGLSFAMVTTVNGALILCAAMLDAVRRRITGEATTR